MFSELVASVGPAHFRESDRPIVEELAQAVAIAREASQALAEQGLLVEGEDGERPNPLLKVISTQGRLIASLATRCRLTPQSRISKDKSNATTQEGLPPGLAAGFALVQRSRHG